MPLRPPTYPRLLRRLRRLGATLLVGLALFGLLSIDWRPEREGADPRLIFAGSRSGPLLAGAGKAEVRLPEDLPLAGYRPFGRKATRPGASLYARSLLLQVGELRTAIVAVELLTVSDSLADRLAGLLELEGADCGIVAATHTHSGPGGYDRALVPQAAAIGRFDPDVEQAIAHAVASALAAARADLGPAELSIAEERPGLNVNRDLRGAPTDDRLTRLILQRPDGSRVAQVLRFAAHPTLNPRGVGPHGDWPGIAMERLEEEGGVAILLQGAVGDARAGAGVGGGGAVAEAAAVEGPGILSMPEAPLEAAGAQAVPRAERVVTVAVGEAVEGFETPTEPGATDGAAELHRPEPPGRAASFASRFVAAVQAMSPAPATSSLTLACAEAKIELPKVTLHSMVPWPLGPAASNLASFAAGSTARTVALRLDDWVLMAVPAEPTFAAAAVGEGQVEAQGLQGRTVSLAQGYAGYAPTPAEVEARRFSARAAWYGGGLSERLAAGEARAAEAVIRSLFVPKRVE